MRLSANTVFLCSLLNTSCRMDCEASLPGRQYGAEDCSAGQSGTASLIQFLSDLAARGRRSIARNTWQLGVLAITFVSIAGTHPAKAVDVFGTQLFGGSSSVPEGALPYHVTLDVVAADDRSLKTLISGVSRLKAEEARGANDVYTLVARARNDIAQIQAALYSEGYYAGAIGIRISGHKLDGLDPAELNVASGSIVDVSINISAGSKFVFGDVAFPAQSPTNQRPTITADDLGLSRGMTAKSSLIIAASDKLVEAWRAAGFPLARVVNKDVSADHARNVVDVRIEIEPGPTAVYGWVGVSGASSLDHDTILEQSKLQPGERFQTADLKRARDRLVKMPSVESVRVIEGDTVDASGGIPVNLEVVERKPRYFGATASVSTTDGAEIDAYWGHRNFFGEGEHLRLEGGLSRLGDDFDQLEFNAAAIYTKPGILDVDTDLVSEFRLTREHPDTYESLDASFKIGLARVFNPVLSGSAALATKFSRVEDAFGDNDYLLISLPTELVYDTRDNRLEPTQGATVVAALTPTIDALGDAVFNTSELRASAYRALDADGRAVLAGRVGVGSIAGASLSDVPASTRFFAGGGGSVRGYDYRSLGPTIGGEVVGGLGYVSASAELRLRVTELFGIVPFVDAATVSEDAWPSFDGKFYVGAGVGLRYYTALGPLRIDVATPLTHRDDQPSVAIYVGLGQAF